MHKEIVDAKAAVVFLDLLISHVHLKWSSGGESSETIESGTKAAAKGGITTVGRYGKHKSKDEIHLKCILMLQAE